MILKLIWRIEHMERKYSHFLLKGVLFPVILHQQIIYWKSIVCLLSLQYRYDSITQRGIKREAINYHIGDCIDGFECTKVRPVPELNLTAYQFKHKKTQADYIHLDTADTDNVFRFLIIFAYLSLVLHFVHLVLIVQVLAIF